MLLSKLLQFVVLLASLIASIALPGVVRGEAVYTVTPTTLLSPHLQYINTSQLRTKSPKAVEGPREGEQPHEATAHWKKKTGAVVREDAGGAAEEAEDLAKRKEETLKLLLDRRLIKR